jgi:hypothetical protein
VNAWSGCSLTLESRVYTYTLCCTCVMKLRLVYPGKQMHLTGILPWTLPRLRGNPRAIRGFALVKFALLGLARMMCFVRLFPNKSVFLSSIKLVRGRGVVPEACVGNVDVELDTQRLVGTPRSSGLKSVVIWQ